MRMGIGDELFRRSFREEYHQQGLELGRFNLAVFGKTGVGKSTLLNAVFGEQVADTGIGAPVTRTAQLHIDPIGGHLGILDTRGLEVGRNSKELVRELDSLMRATRSRPVGEQLHVAWYCVRGLDRRFEDTEAELVTRLHALGLPVVLVLTQVPWREDVGYHPDAIALARSIEERRLPIVDNRAFPTFAAPDPFTGQGVHGLKDLLDATFRVVPAGAVAALAAAQAIDSGAKVRQARRAVQTAVTSAGAAALVPVPLSDAAMLVPIQLAMFARISHLYGVPMDRATLLSTIATTGATQAGRATFTGLLKLVPGAGSVAGGVLSASVATTFTYAMGQAWIHVCRRAMTGALDGPEGGLDQAAVRATFLEAFGRWARLDPRRRVEAQADPDLLPPG